MKRKKFITLQGPPHPACQLASRILIEVLHKPTAGLFYSFFFLCRRIGYSATRIYKSFRRVPLTVRKKSFFWDKTLIQTKMILSLFAGCDALKAATKIRCQSENEEAPSYTRNFYGMQCDFMCRITKRQGYLNTQAVQRNHSGCI